MEEDVVAIQRLPSKQGKIPGIIVRFALQETRDKWLAERQALKLANKDKLISENMTKHCRNLLLRCKEWAKQSGYEFPWHTNGKVFIRKKQGDSAIVIRSEADLAALNV